MTKTEHLGSIFSQKLDRVARTTYFLGAVVPLLALSYVLQRYVLPTLGDRLQTFGLLGLLVSIGVLSLASFFALRRVTRVSLARMDQDNERMGALLDTARALAVVDFAEDAPRTATHAALGLTRSRAAFVLLCGEEGEPPRRIAASGKDAEKLEQQLREPLLALSRLSLGSGRPALQGRSPAVPALAAAPLPGGSGPVGVLLAVGKPEIEAFEAEESGSLATLAGLVAVAHHNASLREAQRNFFTHVTDLLVTALDAHLDYPRGHTTRVAQLANRLGRKLGLDERQLSHLHFSALLHDIGMLKLEQQAQRNARTAARHTLLGGRMLQRIQLWRHLAPIVRHHHEWWDGSGYPEGLSGAAIPLASRIIGLCDTFDAMTNATGDQTVTPFELAVHEIRAAAGTHFDPEIVSAFETLVDEGAISASATS